MKYSKITISGKICTGKTTLFKNLGKKLAWPTFMTGQTFRDYIKKNDLNLDQVEEQNEELTKRIDYRVRDMIHAPGNLIVDGWMSGLMANQLPDVLKVLLVCQDNIRYKRFAQRERIHFDEAKKRVDERQLNWFSKLKKIYQRTDFLDPKNYNLIIDTSHLSSKSVLKKVMEKFK